MEATKTFVENPSGKLAVTVHAPRSLREEEAAYFHGINLEQAHKFAHLNGWQLTVDQEKDDTVSAADTDSFKIDDAIIDGAGGKGQKAMHIEAKVGVSDGAEKTDVPMPTEKYIRQNLLLGIGCTSFGLFCFVVGLFASFFCVIIGLVFIVFRCFNHFMKPYGYAIRKASGNTTSPNYGKQIITRIGTGKT